MRNRARKETDPLAQDAGGERLLSLLAMAIQVEPSLLRAARYLLPSKTCDVGSEAAAWLHSDVVPSGIGFFYRSESLARYQAGFQALTPAVQRQLLDLIWDYHRNYFPTLRYEEVDRFRHFTRLSLGELGRQADKHLRQLVKSMYGSEGHTGMDHWGQGYLRRELANRCKNKQVLAAVWAIQRERSPQPEEQELPAGIDPEDVRPFLNTDRVGRRVRLYQQQRSLLLSTQTETSSGFSKGLSNFVTLDLYNRFIEIRPEDAGSVDKPRFLDLDAGADTELFSLSSANRQTLETDQERLLIERMVKPVWAKGIGRDLKGLFAQSKSRGAEQWYWHPPQLDDKELTLPGFWYPADPEQALALPPWASGIARDRYGLYIEFTFKGIVQRLRWINPGRFMMGSPPEEPEREDDETQHQVTLTQGFWLADTACSQALWEAVMGENPSRFRQGGQYPLENVSSEAVYSFIERLNRELPGLAVRFPTEAEWEYACRAGSRTPFSFGDNITAEQANYYGDNPYVGGKTGANRGQTVPVKGEGFEPNDWGLYHMHGNVWEWCADWYGAYSERSVEDPAGPETGDARVLRGGSWINNGRNLRSAYRKRNDPSNRDIINDNTGFRLARGPKGERPVGG